MNTTVQIIAWLLLAYFWLHTILMALDANMSSRSLKRLLNSMSPRSGENGSSIERVKINSLSGEQDYFAAETVEQVGRSRGDGSIHFHERGRHGDCRGGVVELQSGEKIGIPSLSLIPGERELWINPGPVQKKALVFSKEDFEGAYPPSQKARGWVRSLKSLWTTGDELWIVSASELKEGGANDIRYFCDFEPRAWLARRIWALRFFAIALLVGALGCSIFALWPPLFGTVSTLGAFATLVYFNSVQLFLVLAKNAADVPGKVQIGGKWSKP